MRFEEAYEGWQERRLTQEEAGRLLGMSERNFRRYVGRYEADGLQGLIDRRVEQISSRRAPVEEVMRLVNLYQSWHDDWNVQHFHDLYRRDGVGTRSYTWVKNAPPDCRFRFDQCAPNECAGQFTIGTTTLNWSIFGWRQEAELLERAAEVFAHLPPLSGSQDEPAELCH